MNCPHCDIHVDEHEATRCLDAWISEVVMELCSHFLEFEWTDEKGDRWCKCQKCGETIKHPELKLYSEDISAAWKVLEKIESKLELFRIMRYAYGGRTNFWKFEDRNRVNIARADKAPLAICRTAIKATLDAR